MEFLKVWTSFRQVISPLNDAEKGRLFDAMLLYAETGEEPQEFKGNERFLWQAAKQDIDRMALKNETLRQNGLKGGRPKSKHNQEEPNETKENQTEPNESHNIKKDKIKESNTKEISLKRDIEKALSEKFERFWSVYARKVDRKKAEDAFRNINPDDELLSKMISAVKKQKASSQWQDPQYIPHPTTWLHGKRWEDEVTQAKVKTSTTAHYANERPYSQNDGFDDFIARHRMELEEIDEQIRQSKNHYGGRAV